MLHNKDLEKQRDEILLALTLCKLDLEVQRDDIDTHLALIDRSIGLVNEWALKLDSSISTRCF